VVVQVFVEPTVTHCGHTFCAFCIGQWTADKRNCPICRKMISCFGAPQRHFQMERFLEKMYAFLSGHTVFARAALIADRAQQQQARSASATATANVPGSAPTSFSFPFALIARAAGGLPPPPTPPPARDTELAGWDPWGQQRTYVK
jgi:hypothetical protein